MPPVPLDPDVELALHRMRWRRPNRAELDFRLHPLALPSAPLVDYRRVMLDLPAPAAAVKTASLGRSWWGGLLAVTAGAATLQDIAAARDVKLVTARFMDANGELCRLDWDDEAGNHVLEVLGHRMGGLMDTVRDELVTVLLAGTWG